MIIASRCGPNFTLRDRGVNARFNQEKALVGAFSVITNLRMELFDALLATLSCSSLTLTHSTQKQKCISDGDFHDEKDERLLTINTIISGLAPAAFNRFCCNLNFISIPQS